MICDVCGKNKPESLFYNDKCLECATMTDKEKFVYDCMEYMNLNFPSQSPAIFFHGLYGTLLLSLDHGNKWTERWIQVIKNQFEVDEFLRRIRET